jgi:CheY-like chemotaxis protein
MKLRGRALVVDDDPKWLTVLEDLLRELGLEVVGAGRYEEAIALLNSQYFHLAVIDVRLEGDRSEDTLGLDIVRHIAESGLDEAMVQIVLTGHGTRDQARESFKSYRVDDFIPKRGEAGTGFDEEDFSDSVQSSFSKKLPINYGLQIEFVHDLSLESLASQLVEDGQDREKVEMLAWELDDLLRKLFPKADSLVISAVTGGHSKATVVLKVEPFHEVKGQPEACIVKCGRVDEIGSEAENYEDHVRGFVAGSRHTALERMARTRSLGGIVYSLIGAPFETVRSFDAFYQDHSPADTCAVLRELFVQNCRNWYGNRRQKRTRNLAELYWGAVDLTYEKIVQSFDAMYPRYVDRQEISFPHLDGSFKNPVYHPLAHDQPVYLEAYTAVTHGDLNGGNLLVDADQHVWMIDFGRTGEGHIARDFVTLESVVKFQLLEEESLEALYEFERALLAPGSFGEDLAPPRRLRTEPVAKAFEVVACLRRLAGSVIQPSQDIRAYYAGLFYHTLNLIRYYRLLQLKRRKHYILLSASMLCERIQELLAA